MTEVICDNSKSEQRLGPLFPPGKIVATRAVAEFFEANPSEPQKWLRKHLRGNWGNLCDDDVEVNEEALKLGGRLFSSYDLGPDSSEPKLWIITEADRSVTTLLFPSDY